MRTFQRKRRRTAFKLTNLGLLKRLKISFHIFHHWKAIMKYHEEGHPPRYADSRSQKHQERFNLVAKTAKEIVKLIEQI